MFSTELFVQTLIAGVVIGVLYALMALGITFIYSIVKMINWAMGEFYMIGGYLQYLLIVEWLGADLCGSQLSCQLSGCLHLAVCWRRCSSSRCSPQLSSAKTITPSWSRSRSCSCFAILQPRWADLINGRPVPT